MEQRQYGLIGYPLGHSFSAKFFAEKFAAEGISARYDNFERPSVDDLRQFVEEHPHLHGFNVTIPHKQAVIPHFDALSEEAQGIGAVNVVRVERTPEGNLVLRGLNSDVIGFRESLRPHLRPNHRRALVLGTGGSSKAVVFGLRQLGITPAYVTRTRREATISVAGEAVEVLEYQEITPEFLAEYFLIVNCSPVGMHPHVDEAPVLPYEALTSEHHLYDLVYNPLETRFLALGKAQGATTQNGLEMLHLQALAAWEMWQ